MKPLPIFLQYNCYMAGVDRKDQTMSYNPCGRKTLRLCKKLFIFAPQVLSKLNRPIQISQKNL